MSKYVFRYVSMTSAHAHTRVYLLTPIPCIYVYVSMLYNYAKSNLCHFVLVHLYSHIAPKSFVNAIDATFLAHTPLNWGVSTGLPMSCPSHSRTDMLIYGGRSLHMCSFNYLGSMSHRLRRIPL